MEKLAEMGIVLRPTEDSVKRKGKGKALPPSGHVIFVDGREECECNVIFIIITCLKSVLTISRAIRGRRCDASIGRASGRNSRPGLGRAIIFENEDKETTTTPTPNQRQR